MNIGFDAKRVFHNRTGLGNYSRDLIRILSTQYPHHKYFLYTPKSRPKPLFDATHLGVEMRLPTGKFYKYFYNIWRQFGIPEELKKDGIDLYHGLTAELPVGIQRTKIPTVVTVHDLIFIRYPEFYKPIDRLIYRNKTLRAAKEADVVIAISEQTRQDLIHFLAIDPSKIQVIYQGCQQVFQQPMDEESRRNIMARFNLPESYVLNVGTIEKRKNLLSLVKAIANLDTHLVVVGGETPYTKEVKNFIFENGMEKKVSFLRGLSGLELAALYRSARVFVYPSLFEGFGIPIVEALFSGTPVITTQGGCFAEAGGTGSKYVDPLNIDELESAIASVLNNDSLHQSMIKEGLEHAKLFTDDNIGKNYMRIYQQLAGK